MAADNRGRLELGLVSIAIALACGCSGSPPPTPTPTSKASASGSPVVTPSPVAPTGPETSGTPFSTATPKTPEEREYDKLKSKAESLTLGKGYEEAIPLLRECLTKRPDDAQVLFYLMLSIGNSEDEPSTGSEAYTFAKAVMEKAPGSSIADRAHDYIVCAESEPKTPLPDLEVPPIEGQPEPKYEAHTAYTIPVPITLYLTGAEGLNQDVKKHLWYLEVQPDALSPEEKLTLPKGTTVSIQKVGTFFFTKNSWRGLVNRGETPQSFNENTFALLAYRVTVESSGPLKGKRGWFTSQLDRYKGVDEEGKAVWGVKVAPRFGIESESR